MTAALPGVVEGFSLLVFTTDWLPIMRLTGPLLNPTEIRSQGTSTECIKQKSIRKTKHSRAACFLVHVLLIHIPLMLASFLRATLPFYCQLLLLFLLHIFLAFSQAPSLHSPLSTQSGYCQSWSFQWGWEWSFGYLRQKNLRGHYNHPQLLPCFVQHS